MLHVPKLVYNLVSVPRAGDAEKMVHFDDSSCEFRNEEGEVIALGTREGSLYYLRCAKKSQESVSVAQIENKERLWHHWLGHLNEQSMMKLVIDCYMPGEIGIYEALHWWKAVQEQFQTQ